MFCHPVTPAPCHLVILSRCPIHLRRDGGAEIGQKQGGLVEVVETDDLNGAVHVSVGDANQSGGDAVPAELHGVGVGAGGARDSANLDRNLPSAGGLVQQFEDVGVDVWSAEHGGAAAQAHFAELLLVVARRVGRVSHIDGNANSRLNAIGAGGGTAQS